MYIIEGITVGGGEIEIKLVNFFQQFLWKNRFICIEFRSVYNQKLIIIDDGVITVRNLLNSHGNLKQL